MDQDRREYLEDRGSHQLEVEAYERERRHVVQGDGWQITSIGPIRIWTAEVEWLTDNQMIRFANAILSEVEIAQRGDTE